MIARGKTSSSVPPYTVCQSVRRIYLAAVVVCYYGTTGPPMRVQLPRYCLSFTLTLSVMGNPRLIHLGASYLSKRTQRGSELVPSLPGVQLSACWDDGRTSLFSVCPSLLLSPLLWLFSSCFSPVASGRYLSRLFRLLPLSPSFSPFDPLPLPLPSSSAPVPVPVQRLPRYLALSGFFPPLVLVDCASLPSFSVRNAY